jgi:hypothetical protein
MNRIQYQPASGIAAVLMAAAALLVVIGHALAYGLHHEADEGAAAHVFQLLIAAQAPVLGYFVLRYVRHAPARHAGTLALWATLCCSSFVAVRFLT